MSMKKEVLPEFQNYMRSNRLVQEKYISFYASWARKFLTYSSSRADLSLDLQIQQFIDHLSGVSGVRFKN
jgi:hypothetical protein